MLTWFARLFTHACPTRREVMATRDACDGLEARVTQHYDELKQLRGKVNSLKRWEKDAQDAPGSTNGEDGVSPPREYNAVRMRPLRRW